jgi:hypothetical protein
LKALIEEE